MVHGTHYDLPHIPFVCFDIIGKHALNYDDFNSRLPDWFPRPHLLHQGGPCSVEEALAILGEYGHHGAQEQTEGCVWRVERANWRGPAHRLNIIAKYIRRPADQNGRFMKGLEWNVSIEDLLC